MWEDIYYLGLGYSPVLLAITAAIISGIATGSVFWGIVLGAMLAGCAVLMVQKAADNTLRRVKTAMRRRR